MTHPERHTLLALTILLTALLSTAYLVTDHRPGDQLEIQNAEYRAILTEQGTYHREPINLAPEFVSPVGPDKSRFITDPFGWRKSPRDGHYQPHRGVDISGGYRCEIMAVYPGMVYQIGNNPDDGLFVVIFHHYGWRTRYCHLSSVYAEPGQRVDAGSVIGRMGHTGKVAGSPGDHLHFECWHFGANCDPEDYLMISLDGEGRF